MALAGRHRYEVAPPERTPTAAIQGGEVGNLSVLLKRVVYRRCGTVVSAGVGFGLPTGDDAESLTRTFASTTRFRVFNETVYCLPFVAVMSTPSQARFWHAFAQLDVPLNSHGYAFDTDSPATSIRGSFDDQVLLHLDVGGGHWLYRDCGCCPGLLTGIAAIAEVHYTIALNDSSLEAGGVGAAFGEQSFALRSAANRFDVLNVKAGVHVELARRSSLRVATAAPLRSGDNRWFDAEILVQFSRQF